MQAAIYVRADTADDAARQITDCRAYCAERGWTVEDTYADQQHTNNMFEQLLAGVRADEIDVVVCSDVDLLGRSPEDVRRLLVACDRRRVQLVVGGAVAFGPDTHILYG